MGTGSSFTATNGNPCSVPSVDRPPEWYLAGQSRPAAGIRSCCANRGVLGRSQRIRVERVNGKGREELGIPRKPALLGKANSSFLSPLSTPVRWRALPSHLTLILDPYLPGPTSALPSAASPSTSAGEVCVSPARSRRAFRIRRGIRSASHNPASGCCAGW